MYVILSVYVCVSMCMCVNVCLNWRKVVYGSEVYIRVSRRSTGGWELPHTDNGNELRLSETLCAFNHLAIIPVQYIVFY